MLPNHLTSPECSSLTFHDLDAFIGKPMHFNANQDVSPFRAVLGTNLSTDGLWGQRVMDKF